MDQQQRGDIIHFFEDGELDANSVVAFFATTTQHGAIEGKKQPVAQMQIR